MSRASISALVLALLLAPIPAAAGEGEGTAAPQGTDAQAAAAEGVLAADGAKTAPAADGPSARAEVPQRKTSRPRLLVALDAGHGGTHVGAVGPKGLLEKDVTRDVVARLAAALRARGYRVVLTRTGDETVELRERVRRANAAGADLFLSVHCNSVRGRRTRRLVRGVETYFLSADATDEAARRLAEEENDEGGGPAEVSPSDDPLAAILLDLMVSAAHEDAGRLAGNVQNALVRGTGWPDRGVRQAPFAVLNGARMPAVLVEIGFLSHPREGPRLAQTEVRSRIADALVRGVDAFVDVVGRREAGHLAAR